MLATGFVKTEVPEDLETPVDESIEELEPMRSKVSLILTVPLIWRSRSSQVAFTLQECVPEEFSGLVSQGVVDKHLDPVHCIQLVRAECVR